MKPSVLCLLTTALLLSGSRAVVAQVTVTPPIVIGNLSVTSAPAAGLNPSPVTRANAGTYTVVTLNKDPNTRIMAQLSGTLPVGMTLSVTATAPNGGVSAGAVDLINGTPVMVVSGIRSNTNRTGLAISYTLTAPASAGNVGTTPLTVIFTLTP